MSMMKTLTTLAGNIVAGRGRSLVALALCPVLLAGCAGAGLQSSGLAGPSWQQREALYVQEGEEEGDLGDRLGEAAEKTAEERNRQRKRLSWILLLSGAALVGMVLYIGGDGDDDEEYLLTFDESAVSATTSPPRRNRWWQDAAETAATNRGILPQVSGGASRESGLGSGRGVECEPLGNNLARSKLATEGWTNAATQDDHPVRLDGDGCRGSRNKAKSQ